MLEPSYDDAQARIGETLAPTLVRLSSSRSGVPEGQPLALAAQVRTLVTGAPALAGSVAFRADGRLLGTASLDGSGQAVLDGVRLDPGLHAITASYLGDEHHLAASSAPLPQAVTVAAVPVVVLVSAPVQVLEGIELEAEVVDPHTGRRAEDTIGIVVFTAGTSIIATAELFGGHASTVVQHLPAGRLKASFAGDTEHAPATGAFLDKAAGT